MKTPKALIVLLLIMNLLVFLGQVWPEGAPPFARVMNILCLLGNIALLVWILFSRARTGGKRGD